MAEKKRIYEAEVMALPPLRLVLGDVPAPDPAFRHKAIQEIQTLNPEIAGTVKRLIAHLKDEK
jgi:hypothetical protein